MESYIFLGPPASGKGTQAKKLAEEFGLVYFGTGDLMRTEAKKHTPYGEIFQKVFDLGQGNLVNDDTVLEFVKTKLTEFGDSKSFVFDGFPRTIKQADFLDNFLNHHLTVFNIQVSEESIVERSSTRKICENCSKIFFKASPDKKNCEVCGGELVQRQEDTPEVVIKRLEVYNRETAPLIEYYKNKNSLIELDGEPTIDEVEKDIEAIVNETFNRN